MGDAISEGEAATGQEWPDPEAWLASHRHVRGASGLHGSEKSHSDRDRLDPIDMWSRCGVGSVRQIKTRIRKHESTAFAHPKRSGSDDPNRERNH